MPRNGSGTYTLPQPAFVAGTTISSSAVNSDLSDIANALTGSLPRDGQAGMTGPLKLPDGSTLSPAMQFSNEDDTGFNRIGAGQLGVVIGGVQIGYFNASGWQGTSSSGIPIGSLLDFSGATTPTGWLLCYGQNVSRATYALLFAIIGTTYGSGDGATTFGLPDLRGRLVYGKDNMGGVAASRLTTTYFGSDPTVLGNAGGAQSKTLATANLPAYTPSGSISGTASVTSSSNVVCLGINSSTTPGGVFPFNGVTSSGSIVSSGSISASFTGSAQGGTNDPLSAVNPGVIMNKIIYAGA